MIFQLFHIMTAIYSLIVRLHTLLTRQYHIIIYDLWFIHALNHTYWNADIPTWVSFMFLFNKKDHTNDLQKNSKNIFQAEEECLYIKEQNNVIVSKYLATALVSDRITQPSHTYFVVEHPDVPSEISTIRTFNAAW